MANSKPTSGFVHSGRNRKERKATAATAREKRIGEIKGELFKAGSAGRDTTQGIRLMEALVDGKHKYDHHDRVLYSEALTQVKRSLGREE